MQGPTDAFRGHFRERMAQLNSEDELDQLLEDVAQHLEEDLSEGLDGDPVDTLAAIETWVGLASHAAAYFYAPASPWPFRRAGWDQRIVKRLRTMAQSLQGPLGSLKAALGAQSFEVSVQFPWGIGVGLSW